MKLTKKQVQKICEKLKVNLMGFEFLGRGAHNLNYVINTSQERFVLRISEGLQFDNLEDEYLFLKKTKGKLGPKVFLYDDSKTIISNNYFIEEFIEGKHPDKIDNNYIRLMARWYKDLHKIKIKKKMLPLHKRIGVKKYKKYNNLLDLDLKNKYDLFYERSIELFKKYDFLFEKTKYLSLNHGDPSRRNVFYDKKSVCLIDWEMVHYNIPEADLVFFVWSYNLNKKKRELFLKEYGYPNTKNSKLKFNLRLLAHIWGMISWRLERLNLVYKKLIKDTGNTSNKEDIYNENKEDINKVEKLLKEDFKKLK